MAINVYTIEKVKCMNKASNENQELVEIEHEIEIELDNEDIPELVYNYNGYVHSSQLIIQEPNVDLPGISTSVMKELTGGDIISFREYNDNHHLFSSFEEFVKIKLGIDTNE